MQGGYVLLWIALTLTLMTSKASCLWPDPLRRPWYRALSILYVTALVSWIALAGSQTTRTTALVGLLLPPALWGLTCVVLIPRPNDTGQARAWSDLRREYRVAAAPRLSVTAAVPGACFFMLSAEEHILAYSKKQHIESPTMSMSSRDARNRSTRFPRARLPAIRRRLLRERRDVSGSTG